MRKANLKIKISNKTWSPDVDHLRDLVAQNLIPLLLNGEFEINRPTYVHNDLMMSTYGFADVN